MKQGRIPTVANRSPSLERVILDRRELRCSECGITGETPAALPFLAVSDATGILLRCGLCVAPDDLDVAASPPDWRTRIIRAALGRRS